MPLITLNKPLNITVLQLNSRSASIASPGFYAYEADNDIKIFQKLSLLFGISSTDLVFRLCERNENGYTAIETFTNKAALVLHLSYLQTTVKDLFTEALKDTEFDISSPSK